MTRKRPLWRWDPALLVGMVLLTLIVLAFQRLDVPVLTPIALAVCFLLLAGIAAIFLQSALRRGSVHPAEGILDDTSAVTLRAVTAVERVPVEETARFQNSIDAAQARGGASLQAVLTPNASRLLRRELRTAVDLMVGTATHRAGYLPRSSDALVAERLAELSTRREYVTVPAEVMGTRRPFTVKVGLIRADRIE